MLSSRSLTYPIASALLAVVAACSSETTSATGECHVDADCHGDRVCESGECVDPDFGSSGQGAAAASSTGMGGAAQSSTAGAGAAGPSSTAGPATSSSIASSGSGSGGFAQATPIAIGDVTSSSLSPTGAEDYYVFTGGQGQAVALYVMAQGPNAPFDPDYIDTVITLYDANQQVIAENDDDYPRSNNDSALLTLLPATGQYYVRVTECWTWSSVPGGCADPKAKSVTDYDLAVLDLDPAQNGTVQAVEPDDTAAAANAMEYEPSPNGGYYATLAYGTFKNGTDKDYFELTLPFDIDVPSGRPTGYVYLMPAGASGNGSSTPPGLVTILDASTLAKVAEIDGSVASPSFGISCPLELGTTYLLSVQHPSGAVGANDFYVLKHFGAGSNPLETSDAANGTLAGAEPLSVSANGDGTWSAYVEGDIGTTSDLDHFSASVPAGATHVTAVCGAQREGSGLRSFTATLLQEGGTMIGSAVESATAEATVPESQVPAGATKVLLRASASMKAPDVTGTFYSCGVHFAP